MSDDDPSTRWDQWGRDFATSALASSAFPLLLPSRRLKRPAGDYRDTPIVLAGGSCAPDEVLRMSPVSAAAQPDWYPFDGVDGGLIDNDPVDVVRDELNDRDPLACNPRGGDETWRAVLMINPLLGGQDADAPPARNLSLSGALPALLRALIDQARSRPSDIALAQREDIYSRFLVAPTLSGAPHSESSNSLAGSSLGGLGGYLCRAFRAHDYQLGRRNAQRVLADRLVLPQAHPIFRGWTPEQRARYATPAGDELPIIPLVGELHPRRGREEALPPWPLSQVEPRRFGPAIDRRLQALYRALIPGWWIRLLLYPLWRILVRWQIRNRLINAMVRGLRQHGLL